MTPKYFFVLMKECGFSPSVVSYGCLINLYTKVRYITLSTLIGSFILSVVTACFSCKHFIEVHIDFFNKTVVVKHHNVNCQPNYGDTTINNNLQHPNP